MGCCPANIHHACFPAFVFAPGKNCVVRPYKSPRVPLLGSKPVLKDRCFDEMIDKSAPLIWDEAHNQPCKGAKENENGAPTTELSSSYTHTLPKDIPTTQRNYLSVIYLRIGEKVDTFTRHYPIKSTTKPTASDNILQSEATTQRSGLAPPRASSRQRVAHTFDAARRTGLP